MSSSLLIAKLLASTVGLGGVGFAGGLFLAASMQNKIPDSALTQSVVVVSSQSAESGSSTSQKLTQKQQQQQDFTCQISGVKTAATLCKISTITTDKKWVNLAQINALTPPATIDLAVLRSGKKYFKVEVDAAFFAALAPNKLIDIHDTTDNKTKLTSLTPIFKLSASIVSQAKATHLLGKASAVATILEDGANKKTNCSFSTDGSSPIECALYDFGSSAETDSDKYTKQTPANFTTVSKSLVAGQYYLVQLTNPKTDWTLPSTIIKNPLYANKSSSTSWDAKATLTDVVPVIMFGTGADQLAFVIDSTAISS